MRNLKDKYAIAGIGETDFTANSDLPGIGIALLACKNAILDSGLEKREIDGILSQQPYVEPCLMYTLWIAEQLGIRPKFATDLNIGGATPIGMVEHAIMAIETGVCNVVLCVFGEDQRGSMRRKKYGSPRYANEEFEQPFGFLTPPGYYALIARRHMYEYGTTHDQLGMVAVTTRKHACLNPNATMRDPITLADYHRSRSFIDPLRLLDICLMTDGGAAVIVTRADFAKELKHDPIYISGVGEAHTSLHTTSLDSLLDYENIPISRDKALRMAGISLEEIDFAEIYDCFTITVLVQLEGYEFCKKGEGGPYVEDGNIELGGTLPVNTHGGLLSQAHVDGMNHVTEAVKQLRGNCGERQVKDAQIGLVTGNGGASFCSHSTLILRR